MGFKEPRPVELRAVLVSTSIPRELADKMQALATARDVSLSAIMREALVTVYAPARRDDRSE